MQRDGKRTLTADQVLPPKFYSDAPALLGDLQHIGRQRNDVIASFDVQCAL
jgi:hypothetical protein